MSLLMILFLISTTDVIPLVYEDSLEIETSAVITSEEPPALEYSYGIDNYSVGFNKSKISTNIVEGAGRKGNQEFARFLNISYASAKELEYLLFLSRDLQYLKENDYLNLSNDIIEIQKMISSFINKLKTNN